MTDIHLPVGSSQGDDVFLRMFRPSVTEIEVEAPAGIPGPPGPPGPAGSQGVAGPPGPSGAAGAAGAAGATGATGPQGPQGIQGVPGTEGPPGGAVTFAFWNYATNTNPPPINGQVRTNEIDTMWISKQDSDGFDRSEGLDTLDVDDLIRVKAATGETVYLRVTAPLTDSGTYFTIPCVREGDDDPPGKNTKVEIAAILGAPRGPQGPPGPQGPIGPTGATGATGPQGPTGPSGSGGEVFVSSTTPTSPVEGDMWVVV